MTHPTDNFFHPQPQSGQGVHTQESGDAGLSSNMKHRFGDDYQESSGPVADKGSFVRPIPKGELDSSHHSVRVNKIWSHPPVLEHAAGPKTHPVSAEEGFIKPPTQAVVQKHICPPQDWPESSPEEETVKVLPKEAAAILERQSDAEVAGEEGCTKMDAGNPAKPKGPPLGPGSRRNSNRCRKRAAGKHWKLYLLWWVALTRVPVSEGFPAKRFTCMNKDRCPKVLTIYDTDRDNILFKRGINESLPECSGISPPGPMSCAVCRDQSNITILCSEDVGKFDVEDSKGQIVDVFPVYTATESGGAGPSSPPVNVTEDMRQGVQEQIPSRARYGLIGGTVAFLIVVGALVIYSRCHKKQRTESVTSKEV